MFKQILYTQWRWSAWAVVLSTVAAFAVPILAVQGAGLVDPGRTEVMEMLVRIESAGAFLPLVALAAGVSLALLTWAPDHAGKHVYALSLPIPRWYYALMRYGAGVLLAAPAVMAVAIGTLMATVMAEVPLGLQAHPLAITVRFGLALVTGYSFFFALAAGTMRTAIIALGVVPTGLLALNQIVLLAGGPDLLGPAFAWVIGLPGPWELIFEPWMLISV